MGIFYHRFGSPGFMVYALRLIAIAMYSLQLGLNTRLAETTRGWYGMTSRLLAWVATEFTSMIGQSSLSDLNIAIPRLLAILITTLLWRHYTSRQVHISFSPPIFPTPPNTSSLPSSACW